jgi:hypothetical protein
MPGTKASAVPASSSRIAGATSIRRASSGQHCDQDQKKKKIGFHGRFNPRRASRSGAM